MIFKETHQQVLDGTKTQTRRLVKPGDKLVEHIFGGEYIWNKNQRRRKWQSGETYAVQPGRGKKAVGRIRITKIRRERLQEISPDDCIAEGIEDRRANKEWYQEKASRLQIEPTKLAFIDVAATILQFRDLWNSLYRKPYRWEDNPEVWVLEFQLVKGQ